MQRQKARRLEAPQRRAARDHYGIRLEQSAPVRRAQQPAFAKSLHLRDGRFQNELRARKPSPYRRQRPHHARARMERRAARQLREPVSGQRRIIQQIRERFSAAGLGAFFHAAHGENVVAERRVGRDPHRDMLRETACSARRRDRAAASRSPQDCRSRPRQAQALRRAPRLRHRVSPKPARTPRPATPAPITATRRGDDAA